MKKTDDWLSETGFEGPDTHFLINDNDPDLTPIIIPLPELPSGLKPDGYKKQKRDQKFVRPNIPIKLRELNDDDNFKSPSQKWKHMLSNIREYKDEYLWLKEQWDRYFNGYWFCNKGKATYITGLHYLMLCTWKTEGTYMKYRDRDRRSWLAYDWSYKDPKCLGYNYVKHRREGWTTRALLICYWESICTPYTTIGIQSMEEANVKNNLFKKLKLGWKSMPFWLSPAYSGVMNPSLTLKWAAHKDKDRALGPLKELETGIIGMHAGEFAFDGTKLSIHFSDEVGKTVEANVAERFQVVRECVKQGINRVGFMLSGSTVEEMDARGGANYYKVCQNSMYASSKPEEKKTSSGETVTGMYTFFIPADDGLEGCIDEWGMSDRPKAMKEIMAIRNAYLKNGDIKGFAGYRRKYPISYRECWMSSGKGQNFDVEKISRRVDEIRLEKKTKAVRGNFTWVDNVKDGDVEFIPDPKGRWLVSHMPPPEQRNRYLTMGKPGGGTFRRPEENGYICAVDPYQIDGEKRANISQGGISVFRERDKLIDPDEKPIDDWETHRFVCTYLFRPPTLSEFHEDVILTMKFYGAPAAPERNIEVTIHHLKRRDYDGYLWYRQDPGSKAYDQKPGWHMNGSTKADHFASMQIYIRDHCHREEHIDLLDQCLKVQDDLGDFDLLASAGWALLSAENNYQIRKSNRGSWQIKDEEIEEVFPLYDL